MKFITPEEQVSTLLELTRSLRGDDKSKRYLFKSRTALLYKSALAKPVNDFFVQLEPRTKAYALLE